MQTIFCEASKKLDFDQSFAGMVGLGPAQCEPAESM